MNSRRRGRAPAPAGRDSARAIASNRRSKPCWNRTSGLRARAAPARVRSCVARAWLARMR